MPLIKLQFQPGINKETTALGDKTTWFAGNNVRFRSGVAEKIGGWVLDTGTSNATLQPPDGQYWGVARSMFNWASLQGLRLLGIGTSLKYYIQGSQGGYFNDVTPISLSASAVSVTFAATAGSSTLTVSCGTVVAIENGGFVTFSGAVGLGGNITAAILNAEFQIQTVINNTSFTIVASVAATSGDSGNGGANCKGAFQVSPNNNVYIPPSGWGAGGWGGVNPGYSSTGWGYSVSYYNSTIQLWSQDNYGENLVFNQRNGGIYYWVSNDSNPSIYYRGQQISPLNNNTQNGTAYWLTDSSTFSGSFNTINGILTITAVGSGSISIGSNVFGAGIPSGVTVTAYIGGSTGGVGQYQTNYSGGGSVSVGLTGTSIVGSTGHLYTSVPTTTFALSGVAAASQTGNLTPSITETITTSISGCPTVANYVLVSDQSRFVIAYGTDNVGDGIQDPMLVSWSDQQNITVWYPSATNQAGNYRLSNGSAIITAIQMTQQILVFTDTALYTQQYLGPPYVWGFQIIGSNISILSQNCVAVASNTAYWMGVDKFYMYNGTVQSLPSTMRKYVYENINLGQSSQFFAALNEGFSEVWWFYCSAGSNTIDSYVIYNYLTSAWSYGNTAGLPAGSSAGYVAGRTAWTYSTLRNGPMSAGYSPSGTNGTLIYQETGVDDGTTAPATAIQSYIQSGDFDIGDGDHYGFVWRMVPDVSFDGSNANTPSCYMTLLPRQNPGSAYSATVYPAVQSAQNYSNSTPFYGTQQFTQQIYVRVRGREMALVVGSNTLGTQWQIGVPRIDVRQDGRR